MKDAERIARAFHDAYELLAPAHGWDSQPTTRGREWEDLPTENRTLMLDVVSTLLDANVIKP